MVPRTSHVLPLDAYDHGLHCPEGDVSTGRPDDLLGTVQQAVVQLRLQARTVGLSFSHLFPGTSL